VSLSPALRPAPAGPASLPRVRIPLLALALVALTAAVYAPVRGHDFVDLDDPALVTRNPNLPGGLTAAKVARAFAEPYHANWTPLATLSLQLDYALHGLEPAGYHVANAALHAAAALLLFLALARMTGSPGPSAFVAAVFALHPLHVESVAWVSERRDVLSGFFFGLTLLAYARHAERPSALRLAAATAAGVLGLLSKPMLVTLPAVLLLLDYWPLGRLSSPERALDGKQVRRALAEKLPLVAAVLALAWITFAVQGEGGARRELPLDLRVANALCSYALYLRDALWPAHLAVFYPLPLGDVPRGAALASLLLLAGVTAAALRGARTRPYLAVGWLWFVGMLVPVIGLVPVGMQSRADRYTYLPLVGLALMAAFGAADLAGTSRRRRAVAAAAGVAATAAMALASAAQVRTWRDTESLFRHATAAVDDNWFAHHRLGAELRRRGRLDEALEEYTAALRIEPGFGAAQLEYASMLEEGGDTAAAVEHYQRGLAVDPDHGVAQRQLGLLLLAEGRVEEARPHLARALALGEATGPVHLGLAAAAAAAGRPEEAVAHNREALRLAPDLLSAANNLAWILATHPSPEIRDPEEAVRIAEDASRRAGGTHPGLLDTLAASYAAAGRYDEAVATATRAAERAAALGQEQRAAEIRARIARFRAGRPFVDDAAAEGAVAGNASP